jgi:hypothetical protein
MDILSIDQVNGADTKPKHTLVASYCGRFSGHSDFNINRRFDRC